MNINMATLEYDIFVEYSRTREYLERFFEFIDYGRYNAKERYDKYVELAYKVTYLKNVLDFLIDNREVLRVDFDKEAVIWQSVWTSNLKLR